ncbi:unnamed protein product [Schistosoma margrebowiei]|uniref:Small monomeric GTPase n=1 Tax=Schistosoma margrebowiei TaxID=48269 RepID=A0AA85AFY6_9TREM|nr:unnamed protein product [Schistosoma margrebowiei]
MTIPQVDDSIELFLYNIPGKEVFQDPMNHYINMTNLIVVVFDVTNQESFSSAKLTLTELRKPNNIRIPVVLVGNKIDLKEKHINNVEEAQGLADDLNIPYFETSALVVFASVSNKKLTDVNCFSPHSMIYITTWDAYKEIFDFTNQMYQAFFWCFA